MKKLTEYKELEPKDFLAINEDERYLVWEGEDKEDGELHYITYLAKRDGEFFFGAKNGFSWPQCAEIITRYPRDVPEGVAELPEDKPFFAYVGEKFIESPNYCKFLVTTNFIKKWHYPDLGEFKLLKNSKIDVAIDISTEWAADKFPEIVEAMEYEPVYKDENDQTSEHGKWIKQLIGHKLGSKTYDLEWKEFKPTRVKGGHPVVNLQGQEIVCEKLKIASGLENEKSEPLEEPPDFDDYDEDDESFNHDDLTIREQFFEAGKARGWWERDQQFIHAARETKE